VTPQEIAVSILAELIAVKHGKFTSRDASELAMKWQPPKLLADRWWLSRLPPARPTPTHGTHPDPRSCPC